MTNDKEQAMRKEFGLYVEEYHSGLLPVGSFERMWQLWQHKQAEVTLLQEQLEEQQAANDALKAELASYKSSKCSQCGQANDGTQNPFCMTTGNHHAWELSELQSSQARVEELEADLKLWHKQRANRSSNGNSPNHGHRVKGVWDSDNYNLAGQECGECKLWSKAVALSTDKEG